MLEGMTLRPLVAADVGAASAWLAPTPLMGRYGLGEARLGEALGEALSSDLLLVAEEGGEVCGLAWCLPQGAFGRSPYLKLLAARWPGRGIGRALLEGLEQRLTGDLFLLVSDFNLPARRFYERLGYAHIGTLEAYVLPDVNEHLYRKRLGAAAHSGVNDVTQAQVSSLKARSGQDDCEQSWLQNQMIPAKEDT
jgi:ribosomal protein S18 acetylase RimI-like enzyme